MATYEIYSTISDTLQLAPLANWLFPCSEANSIAYIIVIRHGNYLHVSRGKK